MCDVCSGFLNLLVSYESRLNSNNDTDQPVFLEKREVEVVLNYIQTWPNRQCMCCYREIKNFERFNLVVQAILCFTVCQLKNIRKLLAQNLLQASSSAGSGPTGTIAADSPASDKDSTPSATKIEDTKDARDRKEHTGMPPTVAPDVGKSEHPAKDGEYVLESSAKLAEADEGKTVDKQQKLTVASNQPAMDEAWTLLDVEKLLILVSKVFLLNFPLYVAYKHSVHTRQEDVSSHEAQSVNLFCDLHESEISAFLLRNVSMFCNYGGFDAMMHCFDQPGLPVSTAHAITATSSNIKLWINYRSTVQLFIPLRVKVLQYMCRLSDQDLRSPATKSMADFMWTAIKDPFDTQITFDTEGLALAFKYFTSSTLTMRLAGMAQINAHINMFNDICTSETVSEVEAVGLKLANWLSDNQIISHLFGPNLHVEVIKQSHIVLNFLAVENQITEEHITLMWQAAQLKHCSKTIYDILPSLVKNLAPKPATHLYSLLCRLDPKEHTEQSIYIASALTRLIWMRDCSRQTLIDMSKTAGATASDIATGRGDYNELPSSSENSVSVDGTNSEDEHPEDDSSDPDVPSVPPVVVAGIHKPPGPILRMGPDREGESDNGAPPCKQARHKICCDETTDDSIKVEPDIYDVHQRIKEKIRIPLMTRSITAFNEDATSSDECIDVDEAFLMRKKLRKKRRKISGLTRKELQELQESVSDVEDSDLLAAMLPDSDCSDNNLQTSVLRHIQQQQQQQQQQHHHHHHHHHHHGSPLGPGIVGMNEREQMIGRAGNSLMGAAGVAALNDDVSSFMGAMGEGRLINFLNAADAADHDGSCSSPMSNKSEKNMADFDDEDSPCEEELAQLAARAESLHQGFPISRPRSIGTVAGPSPLRPGAGGMALMKHSPHQHSPGMHRMGANNGAIKMVKGGSTKTKDILQATAAAAASAGPVGTMMIGNPYRFPDVCLPGNTLLWDLLQDDKIGQLGESIALEAEKVLGTLLCFHTDKHIRTRFIEGCLQNLAENRSVVTSLKLLPKLFASFQQYREVTTHQVVLWSERQHRMMFHFFNNLKHYSSTYRHSMNAVSVQTDNTSQSGPLYSHVTQIQVRLQFLTSVFSDVGSPRSFRLTLNQVDSLWSCLANDPECSDCLFSWLQAQVKGGDTHALGLNAIQHLYLKRLSELKPEGISMVALGLFQQLFTLGREELFGQPGDGNERDREMDNVGMEHLWKIALRATNTDVSLSAIQYINTYYMEKQLKYEHQFVAQCMNHLSQAVEELNQHSDNNGPATEYALLCVQRALMLLNTHLDTFRRRYAYHLRRWALEGKDIGAYSALRTEGPGPPLRIVLQPAGVPDKSFLNMHASDLVADLKAEIAKWWEKYQGAPQAKTAQSPSGTNAGSGGEQNSSGSPAPVLGLLLNDGPLRIITQGQEITSEYDERSLADVGFKDNQMVYVSLGGRSGRRREQNENPSMQPPPSKDCLPTLLLLKAPYFEQLFRLMQTLGDMKISITGERCQPNTKAQLLSRRVWDILAMLPTCPSFFSTLKNLSFKCATAKHQKMEEKRVDVDSSKNASSGDEITEGLAKDMDPLLGGCYTLEEILDPYNLQKFMYALHIVESLCKSKFVGNCCGSVSGAMHVKQIPFAESVNNRGAIGVAGTSSKTLSVKNQLKLKISSSKSLKLQQQTSPRQGTVVVQESASAGSTNRSPPKGKRLDFAPNSPGPGVVKPTPLCSEEDRSVIMERDVPDGSVENKENKPDSDGGSSSTKPDDHQQAADSQPSVESGQECLGMGSGQLGTVQVQGSEELKKQESTPESTSDLNDPGASSSRVVEWSDEFMRCGGLAHLYRIFLSGVLQKSIDGSDESELNEWRHDCLASLLRIMCLLGMDELKTTEQEGSGILIPPLNRDTMALFEPRPTLERIASILNEESLPVNPNLFKTGMFGRPQVIHYAMNLLVCYAHSCKEVRQLLWTIEANSHWLQRLILDDPEPAVRREACAALYRLCLGNSQTYYELMAPLLSKLVALLPLAENMKPQALNVAACGGGIYGALLSAGDEGKEPYGPACRDYFWLLCRLVDALSPELLRGTTGSSTSDELQPRDAIGLDAMCQQVARSILERDYLESRHGSPDDGLFGLLNLMANLLKFDPVFKYSVAGQEFMVSVFCCLFELPSPEDREKPKCKSHAARAAAYDLLVEMCRNAPKNYLLLHGKLMQQHRAGPHSPYPWDYWPQDEGRSECGYVGLTNLGATCYMASCIQHLFMTPQTRDAILSISTDAPQKHKATLYELQRMFAYLMESERKAYCPRSFCRVYQMDHQPLNTGEQKDMAEFFIDLVSKLEEMTPDLKNLVKRIFCGVISNNVVSLDCGHVSRTLEEFYTVRCQVADMRNLHESLDEVTVKDTLEGDNMYTCSQCGKKVRAEKRACFKKLPQILCFNTMRYTFNMVTMLKEKVNTHFSFPMRLDMSGYVEKTLMPHHYQEEKRKSQMRRSHSRNVSESSATGETNPAGTAGANDDNSSSSASSNTSNSSSTGIMSTSSECNAASNGNKPNGATTTMDKQENEDVEMNVGSDEKSNAERKNDTANGNLSDSSNGDLQRQQQTMDEEESEDFNENYEYDLVGVTVHTGNADGGHYYSFIKERNEDGDPNHQERWFLFNDAEVKLFDPSQIAAECFGGEMTSKTYDSVAEKYLDFSFEKTNSAYMLFYEWRSNKGKNVQRDQADQQHASTSTEKRSTGVSNNSPDSEKRSFANATKSAVKSPIKNPMKSTNLADKEACRKQQEPILSPPKETITMSQDIGKLTNRKAGITATGQCASNPAVTAFNSSAFSVSQSSFSAASQQSAKAPSNNSKAAAVQEKLDSNKNGNSTGAREQLSSNVDLLKERQSTTFDVTPGQKPASNERDQETEEFIQQLSEVAKESNNLSKCDIDTKHASTARIPSTTSSQQQEVEVASTRAVSPAPTIASLASTASLSPASTASTASVTSAGPATAVIAPTVTVPSIPVSTPLHPLIVPMAGSSVASGSVVSSCMGTLSGPGPAPPSVMGFQGSTSSATSPSTMLHGVVSEPSPSSYSSISSLSALTATVGGNIALPMAAVVGPTPGGPGSSFSAVTSHAVLQSSSSPGCSSGSGGGSTNSSGLVMVNRINQSNKRLRRRPLSKELEEWIWQDNRHFLQDRNIFEHTYFNFMWQICGHIPQSLLALPDITSIAAQLSVSFFIETFIHAKEKPTMVLWVELLTKQFNASQEACEWFLSHMSAEPWWPVQVLIQCPNQMVRQMFQRLVIHVIQRLRQSHCGLYLKAETDIDGNEIIGNVSCVTRFIKSLIMLMEHGAKAHSRHLSEFFGLLYEFSRMGEEEALFLLRINVIRSVADFYLGHKGQECIDANSDNEENSSDEALTVDKSRPASLDKMIALVASLVERSRGPDLRLHLSARDYNAIAGGKGFPFLYQQIKDNINPQQTRHLIHALCRCDERLASQIIAMLFTAVTKHTELCGPFFKLITLLTESSGGPSGLPCFSQLVLQRVWDAAEYCPQSALDWLAVQAPRNKIVHNWILQSADSWVERFLLAHGNARVRNAAAYLLVSLVPSQSFRNNYRATSHHKLSMHVFQHREISCEAQLILHTILNLLLLLLRSARNYTDINLHSTTKFTAYFNLLTYCLVSKTEKLMVGPHLRSLWDLFHPRLSEPAVPAHHNKQALLAFWYQATLDCPENASLVANCPDITRNIAFNYILADHDDTDIVTYNRAMLPVYYGLLRMCCQQSRLLTRQLAAHQNLQWAFKNITPHPTQYPLAVDELFRLMTLFAQRHPDASEAEQRDVTIFRRTTLTAYLNGLDARVSWGTLIAALRILVDNDDDRLYVVLNGGITLCFDALHTLHSMYHEATACHVFGDLQELLTEVILLINTLRASSREQKKRPQPALMKGLPDAVRRLATLLNTFNPPEMRNLALEVLKELVKCAPPDIITTVLVPLLTSCHTPHVHHLIHQANSTSNTTTPASSNAAGSTAASSSIGPLGSYFPRRGMKATWPPVSKNTPRPPKAMIQMNIPQAQICEKGLDKDFDLALELFYRPYHEFLDIMFRVAVTSNHFSEPLVHLSLLTGIEAVVLHFNIFAKFWVGIFNNKTTHRYAEMLIQNPLLIDYIDNVLRDERLSLNDPIIANFIEIYYPKIKSRLFVPRLLESICQLLPDKNNLEDICGDLQAIRIIGQRTGIPSTVKGALQNSLHAVLTKFKDEIYSDEEIPTKKRKVTVPHITIHPVVRSSSSGETSGVATPTTECAQATTVAVTATALPEGSMVKSTRLKESVPPSIEITVQNKPGASSGAGSVIKLPNSTESPCPESEARIQPTASTSAITAPGSESTGTAQTAAHGSTDKERGVKNSVSSEKASAQPTVAEGEIIGPTVMETGSTSEQNQQQQQKQQEQYLRNLVKDIESHIELIFECLDDDEGDNTNEANTQQPLDETDERSLEMRRNAIMKGPASTIISSKAELSGTLGKRQTDAMEQRDPDVVVVSSSNSGCHASSAAEAAAVTELLEGGNTTGQPQQFANVSKIHQKPIAQKPDGLTEECTFEQRKGSSPKPETCPDEKDEKNSLSKPVTI
ncbi:ubiquitin carboxyl-terminal hydrolase puf [Anopheles marshallii]|uniref:ubiquitin carboxyl-terminal hydrolase puf n=1 Tax=Anopheles marshallii TaxID=1521116 RepID=UPI00237BB065|nr:ubiquitin carboxyl-terminal hydrolase puf [Anopheles marshallii]